MIVEALEYCR